MTIMENLMLRGSGRYRQLASAIFSRRPAVMRSKTPFVSFSFDDAPQTAFRAGRDVLQKQGIRGTFFVSLGLLNSTSISGKIATRQDLIDAASDGFEIGCHTFDHSDPWKTSPADFEASIIKNRETLQAHLPGHKFSAFAYPFGSPRPSTKRCLSRHFLCCRGGGQTFNSGTIDLNLVKAYFLDYRNNMDIISVKQIVEQNSLNFGWIVFATHDVAENPSRYGCSVDFFKSVVECAAGSGATILPVTEACKKIISDSRDSRHPA